MGRRKASAGRKCWKRQCPVFLGSHGSRTRAFRIWKKPRCEQVRAVHRVRDKKIFLWRACGTTLRARERGDFSPRATRLEKCRNFSEEWPPHKGEQQGCFSINSMREFAIPSEWRLMDRDGDRALLHACLR